MKTLILNKSKWRCGGNRENKLGEGYTKFLNKEGYMCCLGQFSLQLNENLNAEDIFEVNAPDELSELIPHLSFKRNRMFQNSIVTKKAININDNPNTTVDEKIKNLQVLFNTIKYQIEVI